MALIFLVLLLLLCCSAFFSASETAFFSIDRALKNHLRKEGSGTALLILDLTERPTELLVAILFGNVMVNLAYFSIAASLAIKNHGLHPALEPLTHAAGLITVIVCGEVLPKSLTSSSPVRFAKLAARPLSLWVLLSHLVTWPLSKLAAKAAVLFDQRFATPKALSHVDLARLAGLEGKEGLFRPELSSLLSDVFLLSQLRVKEIMTPRVDICAFDISAGREAFLAFVGEHRRSKIPVHRGDGIDGIIGVIAMKRALVDPSRSLESLVDKAWFIPETKRVDVLLSEILDRDAAIAIVVDEFGGTSGIVTIADVVEEVVGDLTGDQDAAPVRALGAGRFAVSATLSVRELNDILGINLETEGATTIAGLIARQLGHVPRVADRALTSEGELLVTRVEKLRTREVELQLRAEASEGDTP